MAVLQTYKGVNFVDVKDDDMLEIYDTNEPTPIGTWEDGIEATYRFLDEEGNVLDSGTCRDGETPVYKGETPTKEHYTFTGWSPVVGPIYVNTDYTAQFTEDLYTVTLDDLLYYNDDSEEFVTGVNWGAVNKTSVQVPYGTVCSYTVQEIGEDDYNFYVQGTLEFRTPGNRGDQGELLDSIVITSNQSSAEYWYDVSRYDGESGFTDFEPFTVEDDSTIEGLTIMRGVVTYYINFDVNNNTMGSIDSAPGDYPYGTVLSRDSSNPNILNQTFPDGTSDYIEATANAGYVVTGWYRYDYEEEINIPFTEWTVNKRADVIVNFDAETPSHQLTMTVNNAEWGSITSQSYDDVHIGDVITYDGGATGGNIKCNNDNVSIVTVESGYEVDEVQGVPATYDGTPIVVSVIFKEGEK